MTIPVSTQWNVLSFTEGTDLLGTNLAPGPSTYDGFFTGILESTGWSGVGNGALVASTGEFTAPGANFTDAHVGGYIQITASATPGNIGFHRILAVSSPTVVILQPWTGAANDATTNWTHRSGGQGADWIPTPTGSWGPFGTYVRSGSGTSFYVSPGWATQHISLPADYVASFSLRDWAQEVTVYLAGGFGYVELIGCRPSDGRGAWVRVQNDPMTLLHEISLYKYNGSTYDWVITERRTLPSPFKIRMVYRDGENATHVWVDGRYQGTIPGWTLPAPPGGNTMTVGFGGFGTHEVLSWTVGTAVVSSHLRPTADAGNDQVIPLGRWVGFDGSGSTGSSSSDLVYRWKLIRAPAESEFVYSKTDGEVVDDVTFRCLSATFLSSAAAGDILLIDGVPYEIAGFASDTVLSVCGKLPSGYTGPFLIIRQADTRGSDGTIFTFEPDALGLYAATLRVIDPDGLFSDFDLAACNVIQDSVPLGVPLDAGWLWDYLPDFWNLVSSKEWVQEAWAALIRLVGSYTTDLWNIDFDKSLLTSQNVVPRRWLRFHPRVDELDPDAATFESRMAPAVSLDYRFSESDLALTPVGMDQVFSFHLYTETGTKTKNISVPSGTAIQDFPSVLNAALEADEDFNCLTAGWRVSDPELPAPVLRRYVLTVTSSSYPFSVVSDGSLIAVYLFLTHGAFRGVNAVRALRRTVRLDAIDLDSQIKVGDPINLAGRSFQIMGIAHRKDSLGLRFLEIEVDEDIPDDAPASMHWCIPSYWKSARTEWWNAGCTPGDLLFLERRPVDDDTAQATLVPVDVAAAGYNTIGTLAPEPFFPSYQWKLSHVRRHFYINTQADPADPTVLQIPRLQEAPDSPPWIMREWEHYAVLDRRDGRYVVLDFRSEPPGEMVDGDLYRNRGSVAHLGDYLWAEVAYVDNRPILEANFGRMVRAFIEDFEHSKSANYLSICTGLWLVYANGPTPDNIQKACAIISGYPYAEATGTILDLVEEFVPGFSYLLVRDQDQNAIIRSYVFRTGDGIAINPETGVKYAPGDTIERFTILVQTQIYYDYVSDPEWWLPLRASGTFTEPEKVHKFCVWLDVEYADLLMIQQIIQFVMDFRKTHTMPVFVGCVSLSDEILASETVAYTSRLSLTDMLWEYPVAQILDAPRLGSGAVVVPRFTDPRCRILLRMTTPGTDGVRVRFLPGAAEAVSTSSGGGWVSITVEFVLGVSTPASLVDLINTDPTASTHITASLPPGAVVDFNPLNPVPGAVEFNPVTPGTAITLNITAGPWAFAEVPGTVNVTVPVSSTGSDVMVYVNTNSTQIVGSLRPGSDGSSEYDGTSLTYVLNCGEVPLRGEHGWVIVNYRGRTQLTTESGDYRSVYPGVGEGVSVLSSFSSATILTDSLGVGNLIAPIGPAYGGGGVWRIPLENSSGLRFHDLSVVAPPPPPPPPWTPGTQLVPGLDWFLFFDGSTPLPVYKCMGVLLGNEESIPATLTTPGKGPYPAGGTNLTISSDLGSAFVSFLPGTTPTANQIADMINSHPVLSTWCWAYAADEKLRIQGRSFVLVPPAPPSWISVSGSACPALGFTVGDTSFRQAAPNFPPPFNGLPNFWADANYNWVDVQLSPSETNPPVAGDLFLVFRMHPDHRVLKCNSTDAVIGAFPGDNQIAPGGVLPLPPEPGTGLRRWLIKVNPPTRFASVGPITPLRTGVDYIWFFSQNRRDLGMARIDEINDIDTISVTEVPGGVWEPVENGSFVVMRDPLVKHLFGPEIDGTMHLLGLAKMGLTTLHVPPQSIVTL